MARQKGSERGPKRRGGGMNLIGSWMRASNPLIFIPFLNKDRIKVTSRGVPLLVVLLARALGGGS